MPLVRLRYALLPLVLLALAAPRVHAQEECTDPIDGTLYPCGNAALLGRLPLLDMGVPLNGSSPYRGNDIWGWTDPQTERRYALVGNQSGTYFVDVTDPEDLRPLGGLPTETFPSTWRDVKVYADHAFVVADGAGDHGMQVFDLTRLRGLTPDPHRVFDADVVYYGEGVHTIDSAHNVVVNDDTGFAYVVGASDCGGGLHMVDVQDPTNPTFAGCFSDDGYTHDAQCVTYTGPDEHYAGHEICFAFNEDSVAIVDVTDKAAPVLISSAFYPNFAYTHQGWIDEQQQYLYVDDELDELNGLVDETRTLRFDVRDLDAPTFVDEFFHGTDATDHNLYVRDDVIFASNNRSGLRLVQMLTDDPSLPPPLQTIGFFDTHPESDAAGFEGAWSVYPFFSVPDGDPPVIVSDRTRGLFVLAGPLVVLTAAEDSTPDGFALTVAPNPFSTRASLSLTVGAPQHVRVTLYDALGRRVATPFDGALAAGAPHAVEIAGHDLPPGTYFVRVEGERFAATRPLVRVR